MSVCSEFVVICNVYFDSVKRVGLKAAGRPKDGRRKADGHRRTAAGCRRTAAGRPGRPQNGRPVVSGGVLRPSCGVCGVLRLSDRPGEEVKKTPRIATRTSRLRSKLDSHIFLPCRTVPIFPRPHLPLPHFSAAGRDCV